MQKYITIQCPCGKKLTISIKQSIRKKYCSKKCFYRYRKRPIGLKYNLKVVNKGWWKKGCAPWNKNKHNVQKNLVPYFKKGIHYSIDTEFKYTNGNGYRHLFKKEILQQKCVKCDEIKLNRLHVHHIDGDKTNNKIENLLVLCRKHHLPLHGRKERHYVEGRRRIWRS